MRCAEGVIAVQEQRNLMSEGPPEASIRKSAPLYLFNILINTSWIYDGCVCHWDVVFTDYPTIALSLADDLEVLPELCPDQQDNK